MGEGSAVTPIGQLPGCSTIDPNSSCVFVGGSLVPSDMMRPRTFELTTSCYPFESRFHDSVPSTLAASPCSRLSRTIRSIPPVMVASVGPNDGPPLFPCAILHADYESAFSPSRGLPALQMTVHLRAYSFPSTLRKPLP